MLFQNPQKSAQNKIQLINLFVGQKVVHKMTMCQFVFVKPCRVLIHKQINKYRALDLSVLNGSYDPGSAGLTRQHPCRIIILDKYKQILCSTNKVFVSLCVFGCQ